MNHEKPVFMIQTIYEIQYLGLIKKKRGKDYEEK